MFKIIFGAGMNSLDFLIQRIKDRMTVSNEDAVDTVKQYWDEAVDTVKSYWGDVDEAIVEETGIPPASITQLLDDHRQAHSYANTGGNSGVASYDLGDDWILVNFTTGSRYLYTIKSATREQLDAMKRYAIDGKGLNSYIMRTLKTNYAGRNVKGDILIKPGMEQYSRHAIKRIELLEAYRNTMPQENEIVVSQESILDSIRKFLGMSNKGLDKVFIEHQVFWNMYNNLKRSFLSPGWIDKQTFVTGEISGRGIAKYLTSEGEVDVSAALRSLSQYEQQRKQIQGVVDKWRTKTKPIIDYLVKHKSSLNQETYDTAKGMLSTIPIAKYAIKLIDHPLIGNGVYDDEDQVSGTYAEQDIELMALPEQEAKTIIKRIADSLEIYRDTQMLPPELPHPLNTFIYSMSKPPAKIGGVSYDDWYDLMWDCLSPDQSKEDAFKNARAHQAYLNTVVALVRWVDRSIKGAPIVSGENYASKNKGVKVKDETLAKYKDLITQAGHDGLDPVARQFMTVGIESIAPIEKVSNENIDDEPLVPSTEDLLQAIKKFFTKGKDTEIYDTVGKGFLQNLVHEVKKYTDLNWVKTHGQSEVKKVTVNGANLIAEYDKVVPEFIKACQANRVEHHKVAEQAFNNMDTVLNMIERKSLNNSANVEKAITIMKATRALKEPKVEVPKVHVQSGEVKTLTPEEVVEKAKKLYELFNVLGADLTYVKRWDANYINSHEWMDWKYVGKTNYKELYDQVKDPKFTDLHLKAMEHVYHLRRIGVEFHKLQPYIMAVFQLIERSVKDS